MNRRVAAVSLCLALVCAAASAEIVRRVTDVEELLRAIGSDRTIVLASGSYRIPAASRVQSRYVSLEPVAGGRQLVVAGISGLTLRGEEGVQIMADPPGAYVLCLRESESVTIQGIAFGHTVEVGCGAGVVSLEGCTGITIEACELSGSGTVALEIRDSSDISLADSAAFGCSWGAVYADQSTRVTVRGCDIRDNGAYPLLSFSGCEAVEISRCVFLRNAGEAFIAIEGDRYQVTLGDCDISGSTMERFAESGVEPEIQDVTWHENEFADGSVPEGSAQGADEWAFHAHEASGLGFQYPGNWRLEESRDGFVGVMEPQEGVGVVFVRLYHIEETDDLEGDTAGVMARALAAFSAQSQEEGARIDVRVTEPAVSPEEGLPSQFFRGAARVEGEDRRFVLRLIAARGEVYAALAVYQNPDAEELHGADVEQVLASFGYVGGDE